MRSLAHRKRQLAHCAPYRIDTSNPITRGLVAVIVPVGGKMYDILNRIYPTTFGTAPVYGIATLGEGVRSAAGGLIFTHDVYSKSTYTHVLVSQLSAVDSSFGGIFATCDSTGTTNCVSLQRASAGTALRVYHGNDAVDAPASTVNLVTDGRPHVITVSSAGVALRNIDIDGVVQTSGAGVSAAVTQSPGRLVLFGARDAVHTTGSDGVIHAFFTWDRKLSEAERKVIGLNPWQIFTPARVSVGDDPSRLVSSGAPAPWYLQSYYSNGLMTGGITGALTFSVSGGGLTPAYPATNTYVADDYVANDYVV